MNIQCLNLVFAILFNLLFLLQKRIRRKLDSLNFIGAVDCQQTVNRRRYDYIYLIDKVEHNHANHKD